MKSVYFLGILFLLFCSCSSNTEENKTLSEKASNTITMLEGLQKTNQISDDTFREAKSNVIQYDNKGFFGKYWFGLIFIIYVIITLVAINIESEENMDRAKPLSKWKVYLVWLYSGLWGGHIFFLWNKHDNVMSAIWKWLSFAIILLAFILNYTAIMYFYETPRLLSFYVETWNWSMPNSYLLKYAFQEVRFVFLVNIIVSIILIPYWTYIYNARFFRQHHENNKILKGNSVQAERFYKRLSSHVSSMNADLKKINKYVKEDYYIEDPDKDDSFLGGVKRFFKNAVTLGNSSKLEKEMDRLRLLCSCCEDLSRDINETECYNDELYDHLQKSRIAAYRNLYLSKELIGIIKNKISSEQQKLLVDKFIEVNAPENMTTGVNFRASDIQFNTDNFFSSVGGDMENTLQDLGKRLEKESNLSKGDFISVGIEAGLSFAINGIVNVVDLYSQTKEARREVQQQINDALAYIRKAIPAIQKYQAALLRQSEVLLALTQCNKAFVCAYEPLRKQVFGEPTFWKYIVGIKKNQELFKTDEFRKDLQHLILVSSEYNKVNKSKI